MREIVSPLDGFRSPFGQRRGDPFAVLGFRPELVADYAGNTFRANSASTTFAAMHTHTRSGNATMVDSDGLLKWAPHNLLLHSEDFSAGFWSVFSSSTVTPNDTIAPNGTLTADRIAANSALPNNGAFENAVSIPVNGGFGVWAKAGTVNWLALGAAGVGPWAWFDLANGVTGFKSSTCESRITPAGNGWYLCEVYAFTVTWARVLISPKPSQANADPWSAVTNAVGDSIFAWGAHGYRSDLGGMAPVPVDARVAGSITYVPTTSAAVYLPRRNHHVWNGSAWVNEGVLVEPTAATNLAPYSKIGSGGSLESGWALQGATASATTSTAPDGSTDGATISITVNTGNNFNRQISGLTIGQTYTASMWLKGVAGQQIYFTAEDVAAAQELITFTGDWQRVSKTYTATSTTQFFSCEIFDRSAGAHLPNVTFEVWGGQYELGSTPSSYIPTAGATATRAAETLTIPSAKLPWPTPNVIGPELVTNGTFDTDTTGWTAEAQTSIAAVSGALEITLDTGAAGGAYTSVSTVAGKVYQISFDIVSSSGANPDIYIRNGAHTGVTLAAFTTGAPGNSYSLLFTATGSSTFIYLYSPASAAGSTMSWDNISVREINPLAVSIQLEGRATGGTLVPTRWHLDANNEITQAIGTTNFTFTQEAAGVVDTVTGGSFTPGINTAFNIASTHTSTLLAAAVSGTALSDNTTPTALADLSSTNLSLAYSGGPMILSKFRVWAANITQAGREDAST